jgi:hypothetical protein
MKLQLKLQVSKPDDKTTKMDLAPRAKKVPIALDLSWHHKCAPQPRTFSWDGGGWKAGNVPLWLQRPATWHARPGWTFLASDMRATALNPSCAAGPELWRNLWEMAGEAGWRWFSRGELPFVLADSWAPLRSRRVEAHPPTHNLQY